MTTRLKLLCHASTSAVRASTFPADEPLDDQGRQKLAAFPNSLLDSLRHNDRCLTSPALRARQTAGALGLTATIEPDLRDCDYGQWTGRTFEEVQAEEPHAMAAWIGDPEATPHGGESLAALIARVSDWLDAQSAASGSVVAVTHASVMRAAIVCALKAEPRSFWHIDIAPLSLVRLSGHGSRWTLASISTGKSGASGDD
jgi:broad specificity phosphatase PhoE